MVFDNMHDNYVKRLKDFRIRYETEISNVYKLSSVIKYSKGLFKGLSIEAFSKYLPSKYHKGGKVQNNNF